MIIKYTSFAALTFVYGVMFLGSYVSASGLGLSCTDWPTCRGSMLPSEEIWVEWIHRLFAALSGISVVTTAVLASRLRDTGTKIRLTSVLAAIFVITQIVLGFIVIEVRLHALIVAIHLGIGVLLFTSALLTALAAHKIDKTRNNLIKAKNSSV